jgi:hypothetical protein
MLITRLKLVIASALSVSTLAWAQSPQMMQQPMQGAATPLMIGDATHRLLAMQADGNAAAPRLPMLGPAASAGYKRYIDSFSHPIPETFDQKVKSSSSGSGS